MILRDAERDFALPARIGRRPRGERPHAGIARDGNRDGTIARQQPQVKARRIADARYGGRRDGDRFRPLGGPGAKTIGDFFTERKIEPALRARTGILCDQQGPLWVMPLRIDERAKLRPSTRRAIRLVLRSLTQSTEGS